jgi:glutathione synthase/RimK-type ligase-like ATP-grasp enzyme
MKLILANNQTDKFVGFYKDLADQSVEPFDYAGYDSLLFKFSPDEGKKVQVKCLTTNKNLEDYDGVYINGYLSTYELAASVAIACDYLNVSYINQELSQPPSLSKLSMYAKLAAAAVSMPKSVGGTKKALLMAKEELEQSVTFPSILKRADADRGIDNFKVKDFNEIKQLLKPHADRSLWIIQDFINNDGFYLVSFYDFKPAFSIFRTLEERPDGNAQKAHMYKPFGGANANLISIKDLPKTLLDTCNKAVQAMNRQIGSVDCLYDRESDRAYVLEVNYNPQLVTISTFKDVRIKAFLDNIKSI